MAEAPLAHPPEARLRSGQGTCSGQLSARLRFASHWLARPRMWRHQSGPQHSGPPPGHLDRPRRSSAGIRPQPWHGRLLLRCKGRDKMRVAFEVRDIDSTRGETGGHATGGGMRTPNPVEVGEAGVSPGPKIRSGFPFETVAIAAAHRTGLRFLEHSRHAVSLQPWSPVVQMRNCEASGDPERRDPAVSVGTAETTWTGAGQKWSCRLAEPDRQDRRPRRRQPAGRDPSSSILTAASRSGTPSFLRIVDTWLLTVVGEMNRRSEMSAVDAPVRMSSSTSHSRPVRRAGGALRYGDTPVLAIPEFLDQASDQAPRER